MIHKNIDSLLSTGLSEESQQMVFYTDEPKIHGYLCFPNEACSTKYDTNDVFGQGYDPISSKAKIKSVGEFLERLCLSNAQNEQFFLSYFEPNDNFVDPTIFYCYSEEQDESKKATLERIRQEKYRWVSGIDVLRGKEVLIPAQTVFLSSDFNDEFSIRRETMSTGAALGLINTGQALGRGLLEVIERDACTSSYLSKRRLKRIANLDGEVKGLVDYFGRYHLEVYSFDATTDFNVPTALTITIDRTGIGPAVNVGSGSGFDYTSAIKHSILESVHCRAHARLMKDEESPNGFPKEDEIISLKKRFYYWYPTERISYLDFWLKDGPTVDYKALKEKRTSVKKILSGMKSRDYNVFVVDMTLPEVKRSGAETLKVIIPEAHPLYLDEKAKALHSVHCGDIPDDPQLKPHPLT
ncbi:MAG: YcaO-like family protein [Candidatus Aenigmarchaeota archaeon]|nr:YcaO-like family protein [Candidatus Aenigmarchaeota archaeon]